MERVFVKAGLFICRKGTIMTGCSS